MCSDKGIAGVYRDLKVCPICLRGHEYNNPYNICDDCIPKIKGYRKDKKMNKIHLCNEHSFYIGNNGNFTKCPVCDKKDREKTCDICGGSFHYTGKKPNKTFHICNSCEDKLIGEGNVITKCNKCGSFSKREFAISTCPVCGNLPSNDKHIDAMLEKENWESEAVKKFKDDISKITVTRRVSEKYKCDILVYPLREKGGYREITCPGCGRTFSPHSPQTKFCQACFPIVRCSNCSKEFTTLWPKFSDKNKKSIYCSRKCRSLYWSSKNDNLKGFRESWMDLDIDDVSRITELINGIKVFKDFEVRDSDWPEISINNFKEITHDNVDEFQIHGVWFCTDSKGRVLDVHQCMNVMIEYINFWKKVKNPTTDKYKSLSEIKDEIKCYFISSVNLKSRFEIELAFAVKTKAKYWNPAPGYQVKLLNKINEMKIEKIEEIDELNMKKNKDMKSKG